jgi:glycine cleavage system H protein
MSIPEELKYTKEHEWARVEGDLITVGITHHAQDQLGDIVFVELPDVGATVATGEPFGTVESVKAVSDLFAPVSGEVVEVNDALADAPESVNADPYGAAWMLKIKPSEADAVDSLMSAADYAKLLESGA